jgi:hypothetical protein
VGCDFLVRGPLNQLAMRDAGSMGTLTEENFCYRIRYTKPFFRYIFQDVRLETIGFLVFFGS